MRPEIRALILADENHRVLLANRYSWKGDAAAKYSRYSEAVALRVARSEVSELAYSQNEDSLLQGYYPLVVEYRRGGLQKNMGVLYVEADSSSLLRGVRKETLENSLGYAAITLLAALLIALMLHRLVSRRVNELAIAAERIAGGNYSVRSNLQGNDELAALSRSFDVMALSVADNIQLREKATLDQKRVLETMVDGYWLLDGEGCLLEVNDAYVDMSGYRREELLRMCIPDLEAKEETLEAVRAHMDAIIVRGSERFETIHRRKDGSLFDVEIAAHYWQDTDQFFVFIRDISERKAREEETRVAAVAFNTQEAIIVTDKFANIIRVNHAFERITGFSEAEVLGKNPRILSSGLHNAAFYKEMWDSISTSGRWSGEVWDRRKDGAIYPKWLTITAVTYQGEATHYVAVFVDITERKKSEEEIKNLAYFDPLTHMPNRRMLLDHLKLALGQSARSKNHGALMFLDIDHFKVLNDTKGHEFGDRLLIEVARRMNSCLRDIDSVARFGGDEFVVLLEGLSPNSREAAIQTGQVAEKIRKELALPYHLEDMVHQSSSSIGVVLFQGDDVLMDELLKQADLAMYQAKAGGRNLVRFFEPAMQAELESRTIMERALRHALPRGELELHYQLQTNNSRKLLGAEVLLRWNSAELGIVSPVQFIPVAEQSRLILPIGHWVLETACRQLKVWERHPVLGTIHLAVNVSPVQFHQEDFVEQVKAVLAATGANPHRLELELTENLVLEDVNEATSKMVELRAIGVRFSMDDFGTGYSSLQYIKRLPIDQLKIDRAFVRDILTDPGDAVMVQTISDLARNFGFKVIAEGVETEDQLPSLTNLGCSTFQGYLFSKPVGLADFEHLVANWNSV
jgi:diguanylate cyclase (GGDEF)-like protein/PAS domain S-box-containing protein